MKHLLYQVDAFTNTIFGGNRLNKTELLGHQVSERMGKLYSEYRGDRVIISGQAKTYSIGCLFTE
jgi:hypothetical protein